MAFIFFSEIGSPPVCLLTAVGGNILCIPCRVARESCVRWFSVKLFVPVIKSSTYTSMRFVSVGGVGVVEIGVFSIM